MKSKIFISMKLRMSLAFSLVAVVLISLFGYLNFIRERDNLQLKLVQGLSLNAQISAESINAWLNIRISALESRKTMLEQEGSLDLVFNGGPGNNLFLKGDGKKYGLDTLYVGTPEGKFYYGGDWIAPPEFDPTSRPWYTAAISKKGTIFTDYYIDAQTGQLNISIASPLYNDKGILLGVLGTDLYLDELLGLLDVVKQEGVAAALVDNKGLTVAHPVEELIGTSVLDLKDDMGEPFMTPIVEDKNGSQEYTFNSERKTMVFREITSLGWVIVLFASEEVMYAPLIALMLQILLFIAGTLIVFIVLVYFISSLFVKRIMKVSTSLQDISEGEGDLTRSIEIWSNDELTLLTVNFNNFIQLMKEMISRIKVSADSTLNAKDSLVANTEETAAAITEISANMNSMEMQIKRLDESISISSRSVESITGSVLSFNEIREEQAAIVEQTAASISEMISSLKQVAQISQDKKEVASDLTDTSRKGGEKLNNLSRAFNENVVTRLGDIEDMTNIIRGIANQINLLSMNAAIEAAHAGDSGKGFAVVADEIRKLAESSSDSVKTIDKVIKEIRKGVEDTVDNTKDTAEIFKEMDTTVSDFVEALNQIANNTNELMTGSQEIDQTAQRLNEITVSIKDSADSMKNGTEELSREMLNIEDVSRTVLGGIQEAVVGAGEIVSAMDQVTDLSQDLATNSEGLKTEIDRFKTE